MLWRQEQTPHDQGGACTLAATVCTHTSDSTGGSSFALCACTAILRSLQQGPCLGLAWARPSLVLSPAAPVTARQEQLLAATNQDIANSQTGRPFCQASQRSEAAAGTATARIITTEKYPVASALIESEMISASRRDGCAAVLTTVPLQNSSSSSQHNQCAPANPTPGALWPPCPQPCMHQPSVSACIPLWPLGFKHADPSDCRK